MKYLFVFFLIIPLYAFNFTAKPLITLDGVNSNFDVARGWNSKFSRIDVFICFENYEDSQYSIYLKQIEPYFSNNILIYKDSLPQENPYISYVSDNKIGIVWQSMVDGYWQIFSFFYSSDTTAEIIQLTDDTLMNINPKVLHGNNLYWIKNNNLVFGSLDDSLTNVDIIDSSFCSNFDFVNESGCIYYESKDSFGVKINQACLDWNNEWQISTLIKSGEIKLISSSYDGPFFTYQKHDSVWQSIIIYDEYEYWISSNEGYNVENAYYFVYPIPTKSTNELRDWFVVYESDSLSGNKEIILDFVPNNGQNKINISNLPSDDLQPYALQIKDSVAIIWEHHLDNGTEIWWAKEKFRPYTNIEQFSENNINKFMLKQNYPNPFNLATSIEFYLELPTFVSLTIYNLIGQKIRTLVSTKTKAGFTKVVWDGTDENGCIVGSGVFVYALRINNTITSGKMVMLK